MCDQCGSTRHLPDAINPGRRTFLRSGVAGLATTPLMSMAVSPAVAERRGAGSSGPFEATMWATKTLGGPMEATPVQRRALGPNDVLLDILYCGICMSDVHMVRGAFGPPALPCSPGHEIIGRIAAIGRSVTKFRVGDIGGVGSMVDSDRTCEACFDDREHLCPNVTWSFGSEDRISGGHTYGGFSTKIVVADHFVAVVPPGSDLPAMAPLLCAGITTYSPMRHWNVTRGQRVGVIGLGGLGHLAVKLLAAQGAEVVIFTTSPGKIADAKRLGAREAVLWSDTEAMQRLARSLDWAISTVPQGYPMQPFMDVLRYDATLVNVGALDTLNPELSGMSLADSRRSLSSSSIGGMLETQRVIDYCVSHNIKSDIELIKPDQIDKAFDRIVNKDVRYRFVVDFTQV